MLQLQQMRLLVVVLVWYTVTGDGCMTFASTTMTLPLILREGSGFVFGFQKFCV